MSVELVARLKALKLHGMAQTWPELLARARHSALEPETLLRELLAAETAEHQAGDVVHLGLVVHNQHLEVADVACRKQRVHATVKVGLHIVCGDHKGERLCRAGHESLTSSHI